MQVQVVVSNFRELTILAYAAGIIDGEGCISITKNRAIQKGAVASHYHALRIEVSVCDKKVIDFFYENFGGARTAKARPNHKPYYKWAITSAAAEKFLKTIYPYLVGKIDQADLAFAFRKSFSSSRSRGHRLISTETNNEREEYHRAMMALKQSNYNAALIPF